MSDESYDDVDSEDQTISIESQTHSSSDIDSDTHYEMSKTKKPRKNRNLFSNSTQEEHLIKSTVISNHFIPL